MLVVHICMMSVSVMAMSLALMGVFFKASQAVVAAKIGMATTLVGAISGAYLLLAHPVMHECLVLTSYLVAVTVLYRFVFGMGDVRQCTWLSSK